MKKCSLILISLFCSFYVSAEQVCIDSIPANPKDVESVDAIIVSLYNVISGPAGEKRNWDRMRALFFGKGKLITKGKREDGTSGLIAMSLEDYITKSGPVLERDGFFEREIGRRTEDYGSVVHVFSTYDSKRKLEDEKPFMRGINSIQLWNDGKRWWIVSILWQNETSDNPIPEKYLN